MATRFVRWTYTSKRDTSVDNTVGQETSELVTTLTFNADMSPTPGPGVVAPVPLYDVHLKHVLLFGRSVTDTPAEQLLLGGPMVPAFMGSPDFAVTHFWLDLEGAGFAHERSALAVGGIPALEDVTLGGAVGAVVRTPYPLVRLSGAALADWADPPSVADALVVYNQGDLPVSVQQLGGFVDDAIDVFPSVEITAQNLLTDIRQHGTPWTFGTTSVPAVNYAAVSPTGEVWVRASQIGGAQNQIPTNIGNNAPQRYWHHPSVFMRRTVDYESSLIARGRPRTEAITATLGPLAVWIVARRPTHSRWLIVLDGVAREVVISHGPTADLRTPLEIWRALWATYISQGPPTYVTTYEVVNDGGGNLTFEPRGVLRRSDFSVLDYARFITAYDALAAGMFTLYAQTP